MAEKIPGEFVPLDVNYSHDRSIRQAGAMAELLYIRGITYARRMYKITSGLIPDYDLATVAVGISNPKKHASALVREHLWISVKGGWRVRSFEKWNPEIDRAAQSTGGALGNHNRWHADGKWSPDCAFCSGPPVDAPDLGEDSPTDRYTDRPPIIAIPSVDRSVPDRFRIAEVKGEKRGREAS